MAYPPTLTTYTDDAPCPRVEVYFPTLDPDCATLTVYRTAAGREYQVRGAVEAATAGSFTRIDFECPFNIAVTYRAEMFDSAGLSLGFTDAGILPDIIDGPIPDDDVYPSDWFFPAAGLIGTGLLSAYSWLHNPLNPGGAVRVIAALSSAQSLSRPIDGAISRPLGRRVGVMLSRGRGGLRGLVWDIRALDIATADKVQAMLGDYSTDTVPVLCLRVGGDESRIRIPKPMFMGVLDIAEEDIDTRYGGTETYQRMTGDEVAPPVPGLFIPLLRNRDLNLYYASNAALIADSISNAAVNRRYDLAGFAG